MPSLVLIFVDGLGIGPTDPSVNPLASGDLRVLNVSQKSLGPIVKKGRIFPTDATLGVEGLPQSATGQTTLFTGINAAQAIGRHLQGFPNRPLRRLVRDHSLFRQLKSAGKNVTFANAYTDRFFQHRPRWISVTTVMCETAGISLRRMSHLRQGDAVFMDYTNQRLLEMGVRVPQRTPQEAGGILAGLAEGYDLCLYEYFLTDLVGHRGTVEDADRLLRDLDRFLVAVLENLDLEETSVLLTSDHGNIEVMETSTHTRNPVPTIVWGSLAGSFEADQISLEQITPTLVRFLGE